MNTSNNNQPETKVALVTGASRRLGRAISCMLHENNYNIVIHYNRSSNDATQLCDELNTVRANSAVIVAAELADHSSIQELADVAAGQWNRLDLLVNNASAFYPTSIGSTSQEQWDELMASNARAPFFLSQAVAASLASTNGCIINMIDIHADTPLSGHTVYCMAKAALASMTKSLAIELAPKVRVNGISPGAILWPENDPGFSPDDQENILKGIPLKRPGTEQDIAQTALFLASSPYITGQILAVDGGRSLNQA